MRKVAYLLALMGWAFASAASGQQSILQGGTWASGHVPMYVNGSFSQPIVQDSGPAGGGAVGLGLSEMLLTARGTGAAPYAGQGTGPLGTNFCDYDAPITNSTGYHYLCFSPNAQGGGLLTYGAGGGAAPLPLTINLNGTSYQFPFALSGVAGPATSVVNDLACWNNTTGSLLKDCGTAMILGPNTTVSGDIVCWNNVTGTLVSDCGLKGTLASMNFSSQFFSNAGSLTIQPPSNYSFTGDGSTTAFALGSTPASSTWATVVVSGVVQLPSTYSIVGTTLTFSEAPPQQRSSSGVVLANVLVMVGP